MELEFPTKEQVSKLNQAYASRSSEPHLVCSRDRLRSALGRPQHGSSGDYFYKTIHEKAAALVQALTQNHPFFNGNKRMSFMAMEIFLHRNGHVIIASDDEALNMMLDLVNKELAFEQLVQWIEDHCECLELAMESD